MRSRLPSLIAAALRGPPLDLKPLDRQVVVITGASSGIGLLTARRAAERGARVFLISRNREALSDIRDEIAAGGGEVAFEAADVGDSAALAAAAEAAVRAFGGIDSWVNCAGTAIYARLSETPIDEHERLFRTNYFGVVNGATAALPYLRARGGALLTVGSIASDLPSPILGAYAASKHAVAGYINSLRMELNAENAPISVTLIKPSGIDTPIAQHAASHSEGEPQVPPPAYDPALVADAILSAVERPRREILVGGAGAVQVMLGAHFPGILARLGGIIAPFLVNRDRAVEREGNLFAPSEAGRTRSGDERARRTSLYTALQTRSAARIALGGVMAGAGLFALRAMRRRPAGNNQRKR